MQCIMTNTISPIHLRPCNRLMELNKMNECNVLVSQTKPCSSMNRPEVCMYGM